MTAFLIGSSVGCLVGYIIGHRFGTWHSDTLVKGAYYYGVGAGYRRARLDDEDTSDIGVGAKA